LKRRDMSMNVVERIVVASKRVERRDGRVYEYGYVKINVPREWVGKKVRVIAILYEDSLNILLDELMKKRMAFGEGMSKKATSFSIARKSSMEKKSGGVSEADFVRTLIEILRASQKLRKHRE